MQFLKTHATWRFEVLCGWKRSFIIGSFECVKSVKECQIWEFLLVQNPNISFVGQPWGSTISKIWYPCSKNPSYCPAIDRERDIINAPPCFRENEVAFYENIHSNGRKSFIESIRENCIKTEMWYWDIKTENATMLILFLLYVWILSFGFISSYL